MRSALRPVRSLAIIVLLTAPVSSSGQTASKSYGEQLKATREGRTAFFDRPAAVALARKSLQAYPLVVLRQTDPWRMVIGADSPAFALYSDGTAIYATEEGYKSVKLDRAELDDLLRFFRNPDLAALAGNYEASYATDQPDNDLLVYSGEKPFYISVYGSMSAEGVRSRLPDLLVAAYDKLRVFTAAGARDWLPDKVEVMVWPYEHAIDRSIVWPDRWPGLGDRTTRRRGDSYSIYLDSVELPALKAFLATRKKKGAVEIESRKWSVSVRLPFPHENLWMAPRVD